MCVCVYLDLLPEELLSVVEAVEVLELSEQFYWRLGAVGVQLRHVQIIHKDHYLSVTRST